MSKQKSPRGLFCEVNRKAGGMAQDLIGLTFRTCSRSPKFQSRLCSYTK